MQSNQIWVPVDVQLHGTSSPAPEAVSLSHFLLMPRPEFPTQPSLSTLGWPLADLTLPQTPCSQCKGLSPILQRCLPGAKPFQHLLFQGGQECKRAARVLCNLTILPAWLTAPAAAQRSVIWGRRWFKIATGYFKSDIHQKGKSAEGIHWTESCYKQSRMLVVPVISGLKLRGIPLT